MNSKRTMNKRAIRIEGEIAYVPLTRGYEAIIDVADINLVHGFNWTAKVRRRSGGDVSAVYAVRKIKSGGKAVTIRMHRVIAGTPEGLETDHVDGNGLNNRRANLRSATVAQNHYNIGRNARNTSGFKGVTRHKRDKRWAAHINIDGRKKFLGNFTSIEDAAQAYASAATKLRGEFGRVA